MSVMMSEQEHKKKRILFTIFGLILVIIGFGFFVSGPILAFTTRIYPLGALSFLLLLDVHIFQDILPVYIF